jgi:diadenosine tetraphosphate (Ap4A) HIT family hydrolase
MDTKLNCIFCNIDKSRIVLENCFVYAMYDGFPVSSGHMLIIPKNHFKDYFEADQKTKEELWKLVDKCKELLDKKFNPDGYNIGINCSETAGQTVMHLHIHLIPRYKGDVENPRGGVRGVIPDKRVY